MFDPDKYAEAAATFVFYPRAGEGVLASAIYPTLGLSGETSEVLRNVLRTNKTMSDEEILGFAQELGDILWYVTRVSTEFGFLFSEIVRDHPIVDEAEDWVEVTESLLVLACEVGVVSACVRKEIVDGTMEKTVNDVSREEIRLALANVLTEFTTTCNLFGLSLEDVARVNLLSLQERKDGGALEGGNFVWSDLD